MLRTALSAILVSLILSIPTAAAAESRSMCVYDPAGRTGFIFKLMEGWAIQASAWGATVELKPYTDEATAVNDFTAGRCDGVAASGVRLQRYNKSAYTVEAVGAIPTYDLLKPVLTTLQTNPAYAPMFRAGDYETIGIYPLGAVYVFTRDRSRDELKDYAGARVATLDYDQASAVAVEGMGAVKVPADLATLGPMFNNGEIDVCFLPATAYTPFELWHGLGEDGGIITSPLLQVTLQLMVHDGRFPDGFGAASRRFVAGDFESAMKSVRAAEAEIPERYWIRPTPAAQAELDSYFQRMRLILRDERHAYDGRVLSLLKKARCNADPSRAECAQNLE